MSDDIYDDEKRSEIMSQVSTKDTDIEMAVRRKLWADGFRYRTNVDDVPGKPDICHKGKKLAVFIDGCFWHGCPECNESPKQNSDFWENKIKINTKRRKRVKSELEEENWKVLEYWGHEIHQKLDKVISEIEQVFDNRNGGKY